MPAMCTSMRSGSLIALWLLAGVVVVMHAGLQYVTPAGRNAAPGTMTSQATTNIRVTPLRGESSTEQNTVEHESHSKKRIGTMMAGLGAVAVAGVALLGGASAAKATLREGEAPIFNQWAGTVSEGFTRKQEDRDMGFFKSNQRLAGFSHNANLLNGSPQKTIQACTPFLAMGFASYYSSKEQMQASGP